MAVLEGYDREAEKYLKFLEDKYSRCKLEDDIKVKEESGAGGGGGDTQLASVVSDMRQSLQ